VSRLTYGTLPKNPGPYVELHCSRCESTYSAARGDYFDVQPKLSPRCMCGSLLALVRQVLTFEPVTPEESER
jgi:hypothetical protein